MNKPCSTCQDFIEQCEQYPFGACLRIQRIANNLSIDPVSLENHGVNGCPKWERGTKPHVQAQVEAKAPITEEDVPF